jgi:hypothetical protein
VKRVCIVLFAALAAAPAGHAHPTGSPHGGYQATYSNVEPPVLGLQVAILGGDQRMHVANLSGKTVVILDAGGAPFLRFTDQTVYQFEPVAQEWHQVATGTSWDWPEPRISWNDEAPPPAVAADPTQSHFIKDWAIPGRAGNVEFQIKGFLGWSPHAASGTQPVPDPGDGRAFLIAFGLTVIAIAAAALIFYVARRRTSSTSRSA